MKVLILTADSNGGYPVPATKGGAVSTLIEYLVAGNNEKILCEMEILSFYDELAYNKAKKDYPNIKFHWVYTPQIIKWMDNIIYYLVRILKKKEKAISFRSIASLLYYIRCAKKIIKNIDVDKIVLENNIPLIRIVRNSSFAGEWYYHFHNVPRINAGCREEFKKIKKFLCVSKYVADQICCSNSAIGEIKPEKTAVLLNCIDTSLFHPISKKDRKIVELKKKHGIKKEDFVIVFAGRLSDEKGADKVLYALKKLPNNVKLIIVGGLLSSFNGKSDYQEKLYQKSMQLKNRVIFTGYVNSCDMPLYYNLADVAVLPSMWDEPAGLTNIEALSCGLPVITTNSGGIPEYVNENGIILERNDDLVNNIAKSVLRIMNNGYHSCIDSSKYDMGEYIDKFVDAIQ